MRQILTLLLLAITFPLSGENVITVFRVKGEVSRAAVRSDVWNLLQRHDTVKLSDRILIPDNGTISLLSSESGVIHTCTRSGIITVRQVIEESEAQTRSLFGAVAGELTSDMKRRVASDNDPSRTHGATIRGSGGTDNKVEKSMVRSILKESRRLNLSLIPKEECSLFHVRNKGKEKRVSIVCLSPDGASFCLPPEGITVPKGETTLEAPELFPSQQSLYLIFEVKKDYDAEELLRLLSLQ